MPLKMISYIGMYLRSLLPSSYHRDIAVQIYFIYISIYKNTLYKQWHGYRGNGDDLCYILTKPQFLSVCRSHLN